MSPEEIAQLELRAKFLVCREIGFPHPRYLDELLTPGDYSDWLDFIAWYHKPRTDGG